MSNPKAASAGMLLALTLTAAPLAPASAQGLQTDGAVESIVGGEVKADKASVRAEAERVAKAIDDTPAAISEARKRSKVGTVDVVFVPDIEERSEMVRERIAAKEKEIAELRNTIEGSAIFYHAVNSLRVLPRDIVAMEFDDDTESATIFVATEPPPQVGAN